MLKFVELIASDSEKGVKEDTGRWGRNVVVEERRRRREYGLTGVEHVLDSVGGGVEVGLIGKFYFRPVGGGDTGGDSGVGVGGIVKSKFRPMGRDINRGGGRGDRSILEEVFLELGDEVGGRGDGTKVE